MATRLTQEEIQQIRRLYEQCGNFSTVAQLVGRSTTTVANIIKQLNASTAETQA